MEKTADDTVTRKKNRLYHASRVKVPNDPKLSDDSEMARVLRKQQT